MEKINLVELLKECPKGMELDCSMYDNLFLSNVNENDLYPIMCYTICDDTRNTVVFTEFGEFNRFISSKCVIFPKGKNTWEGFVPPCKFKDGDVVSVTTHPEGTWIGIFKRYTGETFESHCSLNTIGECRNRRLTNHSLIGVHYATEEEKQKLFDALNANGYEWNPETKTLEKLIIPRFKVGDRIRSVISSSYYTIVDIEDDQYVIKPDAPDKFPYHIDFSLETNYELVPKFDINSLKPFDKVLVRHNKDNKWCSSLFSHIDMDLHSHCYKYVTIAGKSYPMCIPYEENKHLLGKTNKCDKFYRVWEE